ncbi:MAG: 3-phosphoshikimate 1-carboxyvinyltransferase [Parvicella sp.]|jgi:3-phosphoshikimate 1-carboxyvinyltransferase
MISLSSKSRNITAAIKLTASKSESNRALIIAELCDDKISINNGSDSDDTRVLLNALCNYKDIDTIDIGPAGTSMRFLTSFLASRPSGKWILTGSKRMQQRPIHVLVDALNQLGAQITYTKEIGYPPLMITANYLTGNKVKIEGNISSQFISSLMLIAPSLPKGLEIEFTTPLISKSYLLMTSAIMEYFGANCSWTEKGTSISPTNYISRSFTVEADWSAASYWYGYAALSTSCDLELTGLKQESLQGDFALVDIYDKLGVITTFLENGIKLTKKERSTGKLEYNMQNCPDIAQTVLVTCAALGVEAHLTGLETLKIKETDRLLAMQTELRKINAQLEINNLDAASLAPNQDIQPPTESFATYHDHRMAMSFAPLSLLFPIEIENQEVVTKSYPNFWKDTATIEFD